MFGENGQNHIVESTGKEQSKRGARGREQGALAGQLQDEAAVRGAHRGTDRELRGAAPARALVAGSPGLRR